MADFSDLIGTASGGAGSGRSAGPSGVYADMSGAGDKPGKTSGKRSSVGASNKGGKSSAGSKPSGKSSKRTGGKSGASSKRKPETVEQVSGEVVQTSGGRAVDMLPASVEDVARMWPAWAGEWCELHGVPDMRKASPLLFKGMCYDIGRGYVRPSGIVRDSKPHGIGYGFGGGSMTCGAFDTDVILGLFEVFQRVCAEFDKPPFQTTFADFCGVSVSYVKGLSPKLTSARVSLSKKVHDAEIDAIRQQASRDPVGRIAILNNEHWGGQSNTRSEYVPAQALDSIPAASAFGLIEGPRLD